MGLIQNSGAILDGALNDANDHSSELGRNQIQVAQVTVQRLNLQARLVLS